MSRIVPAEELDLIERIISEYPEGIGISALERALADQLSRINRRTLQRRLKRLQEDRRIITKGESIALVYKPAPGFADIRATLPSLNTSLEASDYIPVSKEGAIIRDLVRQPLTQRKPIGYQRSFLEEYKPGVTFYLSESLRSQLHEIGGMQAGKRPAGTYARETSRLDGNTYSRLDTEKLIAFGQV